MNRYTLVCADMAGTTVTDDGIVEQAAAGALAECGLEPGSRAHEAGMTRVRDTMGQSKITVFRSILSDEAAAVRANIAFEKHIGQLVDGGQIAALPGAEDALAAMRSAGIKVALTTGFSPETQQAIIDALAWNELIDLAVTPSPVLRGRPYPDMILHAVLALGVEDVRQVATVGDSTNDVYSGLRAGAGLVAGVTTGAHDGNALRRAGATHVLGGITELTELLLRR